ncbi:MAG: alpha/beta-hydrolase family protein [Ilumatobacteraceae bacterium]
MKLLLLPKWARRLITVPALFVLFLWALGLLPVWLLVTAFVSRFVPGRWRLFRLAWFTVLYLALEVGALAVLFWYWLASGFGRHLGDERWLDRHYRLLAWFLRRLMASARVTFSLRFAYEGDVTGIDTAQPLLVLSRHAGAGDSFLIIDRIVNGARPRRPQIVLKDLLQLDPSIDVILNRVGATFVSPSKSGRTKVVDELARLAGAATGRDAVVLFPEGGNVTPERKARAPIALRDAGRPDLAERAEALQHLLPPKVKGVDTALTHAPQATVVLVGHTGLESLSGPRQIWRHLPVGHTIRFHAWVYPPEVLPAADDREAWLYDRWDELDQWVDGSLAEQAEEQAALAAAPPPALIRLRRRLAALPTFGSMLGAVYCWWISLWPSLLPRSPLIQAAVSAISIAIGFGLGGVLHRLIRSILRTTGKRVPPRVTDIADTVLLFVAVFVLVLGPVRWVQWQREQRSLVGMGPLAATAVIPMLLLTALLAVVLITIGRVVKHAVYRVDRAAARRMPRAWSRWVAGTAVLIVVAVGLQFAVDGFSSWADGNFSAFDDTTAEGIERPTSPVVSGGPDSLVDFDDLGYEGRNFVGTASDPADIAEVRGLDAALQPVRVYVGLQSADSLAERVDLAVRELERTGAFDRAVLVVVTPTGTGWVNPNAARTLEYMWGGDTAIVSVQYSYLPSWVAFLLDTESPPQLGAALFAAVHEAWSARPEGNRPRLIAYGESLGSFGGEAAFDEGSLEASVAAIVAQCAGALFVGPTAKNPIYGALVDDRPAGPSWAPEWPALTHVRLANNEAGIPSDDSGWATPRVLYLHHPSDAIGTWRPGNLLSDPGWGADPPPADLPSATAWNPLVGFVQESFDLMNGFSASPGYGHDYRNELTRAWAALVPPPGWTDGDTDALNAALEL